MSQFQYINAKSVQEKKKIVKECIKLAHTLWKSTGTLFLKTLHFCLPQFNLFDIDIETHQKQKSKFITRKETRQMDRQDETKY